MRIKNIFKNIALWTTLTVASLFSGCSTPAPRQDLAQRIDYTNDALMECEKNRVKSELKEQFRKTTEKVDGFYTEKQRGLCPEARTIRELDEEVPIVILSAHNEDSFFMDSIKYGVSGYLLKPLHVDQLAQTLHKIVIKYKYINELKEKQHLLETYQEATNQRSIVSKTDTKGYITFVNDAFCEISGYTQEELLGKKHNIIRHPDNPKIIFQEMWDTIKNKKSIWKGIVRNQSKSSKSYYTDSIVMPILDLDNNITEYISLRNDITDIMNPTKQLNNEISDSKEPLLIYIKLDGFNDLEDFYTHSTIETLQIKVTDYLENKFSKLYDFDKIYQLGNGEYALVLKSSTHLENKKEFITKLKELQETIKDEVIDFDSIKYDISIIISFAYENERILESVKIGIKRLEKRNKNFILSNNLAMIEQEKAKENMKTVFMIKNAIQSSKIVSYFQPIIDNKTKEIVKYESLVRLINEEDKVISPFFFLDT